MDDLTKEAAAALIAGWSTAIRMVFPDVNATGKPYRVPVPIDPAAVAAAVDAGLQFTWYVESVWLRIETADEVFILAEAMA